MPADRLVKLPEGITERVAATLILEELVPRLKRRGLVIEDSPVSPDDVRWLALGKVRGLLTTAEIREMLDGRLG